MPTRFLRQLVVALALAWLLGTSSAIAQEAPKRSQYEQLADSIVAAVEGADEERLAEIGSNPAPDPWEAVEILLREGHADVAASYAAVVGRVSRPRLVEYVESRTRTPHDPRVFELHDRTRRTPPAECAGLDLAVLDELPPSVTMAKIHSRVAHAFWRTRRPRQALDAYQRRIDVANRIGWVEGATRAHNSYARLVWLQGDHAASLEHIEALIRIATANERFDWVGEAHEWVALQVGADGRLADAVDRGQLSLDAYRRHGVPSLVMRAVFLHGERLHALGQNGAALLLADEATERCVALGAQKLEPRVRNLRAGILAALSRHDEALAEFELAAAAFDRAGFELGRAVVDNNVGLLEVRRGRAAVAREHFKHAIAVFEAKESRKNLALAWAALAGAHEALGDLGQARAAFKRSLQAIPAEGDPVGTASRLNRLGQLEYRAGNLPEAAVWFARAVDLSGRIQKPRSQATGMLDLALVETDLGRFQRAGELVSGALRIAIDHRLLRTQMRARLARVFVLVRADEYQAALEAVSEARALAVQLGDRNRIAALLREEGMVLIDLDRHDEAVEVLTALVELVSDGADWHLAYRVNARLYRAEALLALGRYAEAAEDCRAAQVLSAVDEDVQRSTRVLVQLALCELLVDRVDEAKRLIREALPHVAALGAGLSEQDAAHLQANTGALQDIAHEVAMHADDPEFMAWVLERTAANALRRGMGSREALANVVVPAELLDRMNVAREREANALRALEEATEKRLLKDIRAARSEVDDARSEREELATRLQREAASAAALVDPTPHSLAELQAALLPGDALIHFVFGTKRGGAFVVRPGGAEFVSLGRWSDLDALLDEALLDDDPHLADGALERLRAFLVDPLELPKDVERVLVVPRGRLAYVPFPALLPDRDLAFVPSGTSLQLLTSMSRSKGAGVLAVGDPAYRGGLARLPGTRSEAQAVGTVTLLGDAATESGLLEALAKRARWRAIHFACHGLVDPDRPMLSSLALTPDDEDDGFLSCMELYGVKTPADLVVLSACQTARGRLYSGEGVLGLTRAFMHGGSPRVICSLWNVDDAATSTLMKKFYELWNPADGRAGLPTATALRKAQAFVRAQPGWEHPRYWAAWVLWGLAD